MSADLLGHDPEAITTAVKIEAIERELKYRRYVYPKRVVANQMTQKLADRQIKIMEEILSDYKQGRVSAVCEKKGISGCFWANPKSCHMKDCPMGGCEKS